MDPKALFLEHLDLIGQICESTCRRNGVFDDDARDFEADVRLKLVEQEYAVLRKFQGRSSVGTYLTVVIGNLFRDARIKERGKWRASAKAHRLGQAAVLVETLLYRDGHSLEEACQIITTNTPLQLDAGELRALAQQLPRRTRRTIQGGGALDARPGPDTANGPVLDNERASRLDRARSALERVLATFDHEDRVILRMRFEEGFTVAQVARALDLKQRPLYDRAAGLLKRLRARLEAQGIGADVMEEI